MWLDGKKAEDVNLIQSAWSGVVNSGLSLPGKVISSYLTNTGTPLLGVVIGNSIVSGSLVGLGFTLTTKAIPNMPSYTLNDIKEDRSKIKKYLDTLRGTYVNY